MALLNIHIYGDPVLRERAREIERIDDDLKRLIADMAETMYAAKGVGLAATQVGDLRRVFIADVDWATKEERKTKKASELLGARRLRAFINLEIVESSPEDDSYSEGCLSIPGVEGEVYRPLRLKVRYLDESGAAREESVDGMLARVIQHELDHLNGVMFVDRMGKDARRKVAPRLTRLRQIAADNPRGLDPLKTRGVQ